MEIKRDSYLKQLISYGFDGLVKVITGIRRCGKIMNCCAASFLWMWEWCMPERSIRTETLSALREIDFVVTSGGRRTYIQSAYGMGTEEKMEMELRPFALVGDSFLKIVVRADIGRRWYDDNRILNINFIDFLLDKELI